MVPLNRLPKGNVLDEWYPLLPSSHAKVEIGSVRVKSKFTVRKVEVYPGYQRFFRACGGNLWCQPTHLRPRSRKVSGTQGRRGGAFYVSYYRETSNQFQNC